VVTNAGATIYVPFVYCNHNGGRFLTTFLLGNSNRTSPFVRYQFRNIRNATLRMNYGSTMRIYVVYDSYQYGTYIRKLLTGHFSPKFK
jgi:hypothetical protein